MKETRKYMATFLTAGIAMAVAAPGHAVFQSQGTPVTKTAVATLVGTGLVTMNSVLIKKVSDNSTQSQLTWTGVTLPASWVVADSYILLDAVITASGGGIQTYTDNTAGDASPKFTGDKTQVTPAGLIDNTDTTKKLPTAWNIRHSTGIANSANPNANVGESSLWLYYEDKAQVAIPSLSAGAFTNGDPFVTTENTTGIHFAQGPTQFGPPIPNPALTGTQNAIYVEADFTTALTPRTYSTTTLRLEAFTQ